MRIGFKATLLATMTVGLLLPGATTAHADPQPWDGYNPSVIAAYSLAAPVNEVPSGLVARAVIPHGAACPNVVVTVKGSKGFRDTEVVMYGRNLPATTYPAFSPIIVCNARMPQNAVVASILGHPIPAHMPSRARSIAMFGDSGCRIWTGMVQNCADPAQWPLASISQSIAERRPDAVIFNGDFFYRESGCPTESQQLCGSSPPPVGGLPFEDSAYGWIADVLLPMAPVLATAPLIVTRGNHEECNRGGNGYFLLFDPRRDTVGTCAPTPSPQGLVAAPTVPTGTYAIDLPVSASRTLRLAIVDSAGGSDTTVDAYAAIQRPAYVAAQSLTRPKAGRESWLVTHRPIAGYVSTSFAQPGVPFDPWSSLDQTAASYGLLDSYALMFGSHEHIAQVVQMPGLPGQLVLGNGGTELDSPVGYPLPTSGPVVGNGQQLPAPTSAWVAAKFGFAMAYPNATAGSWRFDMIDPLGARFARCGLLNRSISCRDTPNVD